MDIEDDLQDFNDDEVILYDEKPDAEDVVELHKPDNHEIEITFELPQLPGSDFEGPIEVSSDDPIEVDEKDGKGKGKDKNDLKGKEIEIVDPWNWQQAGPENFLAWVHERFSSIPRHSGVETAGIERAIAYLKRINSEISKAVSGDFDGKIDIAKLERGRKEIYSGIERLEEARDKFENTHYKKKKANSESELVKEAKQTHVGGIIVTVPIFISRLARICINGMVSAGHDIEDIYGKLVKKHNLSDRDQAELMQLLADMGYPLRRDRGYNTNEEIDTTSSDNYDWAANYPA